MRYPKIPVKLKVSKAMTDRSKELASENRYIRLTKAMRNFCDASGNTIEVQGQGISEALEIHRALIQDCKNTMATPVGNSGIVGFVTKATYDRIMGKTKDVWISESIDNLIVGSDPEFGLIGDNGEFIYADGALPDSHAEQLGTDGPCMEIRPNPSSSIDDHIDAIQKLLKIGSRKKEIADITWYTGASYKGKIAPRVFTLGGHIHIGNPQTLEQVKNNLEGGDITSIHRRVIRVLDELVGIPLTRVDGPDASFRRKTTVGGGPYGYFGDFRTQNGRFEWRTPSAVWFTHPDIAAAVIGTTKAVSEECYRVMAGKSFALRWVNARFDNKVSFLRDMGCSSDAHVKEILHNSSLTLVSDEDVSSIHTRLKNMSTYEKYKEYIDAFIKYTSVSSTKAASIKFDKFRNNWLNKRSFEL